MSNYVLADDAFDLIIRNGSIIDGTRRPRFQSDVGIRDGLIAAIGDLSCAHARDVFDAEGKIVAPGFIDSHTHDDCAVLAQPDMHFKLSQGVTTVITGNCGISIAPLSQDAPMPAPLNLLDGEGHYRFSKFDDYFRALENHPAAVNVASLIGHSTLRVMAMDRLDRAASAEECAAMRIMLQQALDAGVLGMSTGTYYPPAAAAPTEELLAVGQPLGAVGAMYVTHMRDEADNSLDSLAESFHIGRVLNVPVVISHHKLQRTPNFGRSEQTLPVIENAMQHQSVALDCYPYNASSTMLHTVEHRLHGAVMIASSVAYPDMVGRYLGDIAEQWQMSRAEAAQRLQPASAVYFSMDEADVRRILAFEQTMIGSDGIPTGERPHPRLWGTFPRVLGLYSRDLGLFSLETAVWKMTGLTARNFRLAGRGSITLGAYADVVVFDPTTVHDMASYENPTQPAQGIEAVWVNGHLTWQQGQHTGAFNGKVLRRGSA
ncbi:D-aminoacylase [Herbaspirillum rubrisubalbicans]|uniref:N-acyl-D-amino-acid deacylase family protein n=1 Tax=Herbaspirillum rubrisubalbicans TaxID=80842 RepID=UPI00209D614E|nr:D-aminoacylase [Herbaspirillum rubrisubalbicans]MCP1576606.1 N-acyl-D-amino-acid deacylase [Herbaspirillum rubrisubalbicans]